MLIAHRYASNYPKTGTVSMKFMSYKNPEGGNEQHAKNVVLMLIATTLC